MSVLDAERQKLLFVALSVVVLFSSTAFTIMFVQDNYAGNDAYAGDDEFINECWFTSNCPLVPPGGWDNLKGVDEKPATVTPSEGTNIEWDKVAESISVNDKESHVVLTIRDNLPGKIIAVRDGTVTYSAEADGNMGVSIPVKYDEPMTLYYQEGDERVELYPENVVEENADNWTNTTQANLRFPLA